MPKNIKMANIPKWERPNHLVLKLICVTLLTINIVSVYHLVFHLLLTNPSPLSYYISSIIYCSAIVTLSANIILCRYQSLIHQIDHEFTKRQQTEEELQKANDVLEERIRVRTEELEINNYGLQREIIERKQFEMDLRTSEEKYRLLVSKVPAVVFKSYMDWTIDFFDDKIEKLTGYKKEDFDSRRIKWSDLIFKGDILNCTEYFYPGIKGRWFIRKRI